MHKNRAAVISCARICSQADDFFSQSVTQQKLCIRYMMLYKSVCVCGCALASHICIYVHNFRGQSKVNYKDDKNAYKTTMRKTIINL